MGHKKKHRSKKRMNKSGAYTVGNFRWSESEKAGDRIAKEILG